MTTTFTQFLKLAKPDFRSGPWADDITNNFDLIDSAIANSLIAGNILAWSNAYAFKVGQIAIDTVATPPTYWICDVNHTSAASPTTFLTDRAAHPTFWTSITFGINPRGAWANNTAYGYYDIAYDSTQGIVGICLVPHTSPNTGFINTVPENTNWVFIVNLPAVGVTPASSVSYDDSVSLLPGSPTNVQTALVAVDARIDAAAIVVSGQAVSITALQTSDTAQNTSITTNSGNITTLQTNVAALQSSDTNQTARLNTIDAEIAALGAGFPASTAMLFWQAAAPTGWTKSTVHNDKALRVVSGTGGGNGGTVAFSTAFGRTATDALTLAVGQIPAHTHAQRMDAGSAGAESAPFYRGTSVIPTVGANTDSGTGGGGSHTHGMDIRVQYLDLIICTKN